MNEAGTILTDASRAAELLAAGDARGALAVATEACGGSPARAEAHYVRGQAAMALGEAADAEQAFRAAIQLRPGWADAWVNLGFARYAQGAAEHAVNAMRHALRIAPGRPAATADLGALLRIAGHCESAEAPLRAALAADPGNAGARLNLAAELLGEARAADALALLDAAEPPADVPMARHWHLQRVAALVGAGRPADARNAMAPLEALGPGVDVRVVARAGLRVTGAVTLSLLALGALSLGLIRVLGLARPPSGRPQPRFSPVRCDCTRRRIPC